MGGDHFIPRSRSAHSANRNDARVVEQFRGTTNGVVTTFVVATTVE